MGCLFMIIAVIICIIAFCIHPLLTLLVAILIAIIWVGLRLPND